MTSGVVIPLKREAQAGGNIPLLPPGIYQGKIEEIEVKTDTPSGHPSLKMRLKFVVNREGVPVWTNVSMAPAARFRVEQLLDAIGAPAEGQLDVSQIKGNQVFVKIKNGSWEGTPRNEVEQFLKPDTVKKEQVLNAPGARGPAARGTAAGPARPAAARRPAIVEMESEEPEEGQE